METQPRPVLCTPSSASSRQTCRETGCAQGHRQPDHCPRCHLSPPRVTLSPGAFEARSLAGVGYLAVISLLSAVETASDSAHFPWKGQCQKLSCPAVNLPPLAAPGRGMVMAVLCLCSTANRPVWAGAARLRLCAGCWAPGPCRGSPGEHTAPERRGAPGLGWGSAPQLGPAVFSRSYAVSCPFPTEPPAAAASPGAAA